LKLTQTVYRAHNPRWSWAPDSGDGAAGAGGRFNPVGMPALCTSLRFQTAWLEAQQAFPFKAQPMTICAYDVDCDNVLDLTDPAVLESQGISPGDLSCPWEDLSTRGLTPSSRTLTKRLVREGVSAIIVPSFAAGATSDDINVVFWDWSRDPPHQVRVIDDHGRLPRDARSWH
jgi:RES domain-containing protein